jgi:hypothetical protein
MKMLLSRWDFPKKTLAEAPRLGISLLWTLSGPLEPQLPLWCWSHHTALEEEAKRFLKKSMNNCHFHHISSHLCGPWKFLEIFSNWNRGGCVWEPFLHFQGRKLKSVIGMLSEV